MDATRTRAAKDAAGAEKAGKPARPAVAPAERARARAYLDLWERNLVHVALHGPGLRPGAEHGRGRKRPPA